MSIPFENFFQLGSKKFISGINSLLPNARYCSLCNSAVRSLSQNDSNTSIYMKKQKAVEQMKQIAIEAGIIEV